MALAQIGFYLCLFFFFFSIKRERNFANPLTLFSFVWALVFLFSSMQLYTLDAADYQTYFLLLLGTISFILGCLIAKSIKVQRWTLGKHAKGKDCLLKTSLLRYKVVYFLLSICIVYYLVSFFFVFSHLDVYNLGNVQSALQEENIVFKNSKIVSALALLVIFPLTTAAPAIAAADMWYGRKDKFLMIEICCLLLLRTLSSANRSGLIILFVYLIVLGLLKQSLTGKNVGNVKKNKKIVTRAFVVGAVIFSVLTISRGAEIFRNIYCNFGMPPMMFEMWQTDVDARNWIGYGTASLNGFLNSFFYVLKNAFFVDIIPDVVKKMYDVIVLTDVEWKYIGSRLRANAYVSMFWFFYLDFRMIGIVLGSVLYGFFVTFVYEKLKKNPSSRVASMYCLVIYGVMFSFVRFQFAMGAYSLALMYIVFLCYRKGRA